jgi:S1 RNA binding domain
VETDETQLAIWRLFLERIRWQAKLDEARESDDGAATREAEDALSALPEVSALDALRANADLIRRLSMQRWIGMKVARDEGANMEEIGAELRVSRQAAWEFLKRKIEEHGGDVTKEVAIDQDDGERWMALQEKIEKHTDLIDDEDWVAFVTTHQTGDVIGGVIARVVPFGAFIELDEPIPGFIPRSNAPELPSVGERVSASIDVIDHEKRRVSLKIVD